jgi:hypothetical protein
MSTNFGADYHVAKIGALNGWGNCEAAPLPPEQTCEGRFSALVAAVSNRPKELIQLRAAGAGIKLNVPMKNGKRQGEGGTPASAMSTLY